MDDGARFRECRVNQDSSVQVSEQENGKKEQPGCQHERSSQRWHIPGAKKVGESHEYNGREDTSQNDVHYQHRTPLELDKERETDACQDTVKAEEPGPDEVTVRSEHHSGHRAG